MSRMCTIGRHGVPSLVIAIFFVVHAKPARLLRTTSKRILGDAPKAVALRRNVGQNSASASAPTSRSTKTLHLAYAVCGRTGESSSTNSASLTPYTLQDDAYTNLRTPACFASRANLT